MFGIYEGELKGSFGFHKQIALVWKKLFSGITLRSITSEAVSRLHALTSEGIEMAVRANMDTDIRELMVAKSSIIFFCNITLLAVFSCVPFFI